MTIKTPRMIIIEPKRVVVLKGVLNTTESKLLKRRTQPPTAVG